MSDLKPCPFCGGEGKLSAKDHLFGGYNGMGQSRREYLIRVICNKCKSRGKPIATGWVNTTNLNYKLNSKGICFYGTHEDKANVEKAIEKAIEAWNRRVDNE